MPSGNEYLTSNHDIAYPFVEDAVGITDGTMPRDMFVDMVLICSDLASTVYLRRISRFYWPGPDTVFSLQLEDQNGELVYSGSGYWAPAPGLEYVELPAINSWETPLYNPAFRAVVRVTAFEAFLAGGPGPYQDFGTSLPLETSVVVPRPKRVDSLELYRDGLPDVPNLVDPGPIAGDVQILSGYNIDQFVEEQDVDVITSAITPDTRVITVAAIAGSGAGPYPCEDDAVTDSDWPGLPQNAADTLLQQVTPDDRGNIIIEGGAEQCYSIVPYPSVDTIQIQGTCEACCTCEDYERVALALQSLQARSVTILDELTDTRDNHYEPGVTHFNNTIAPIYLGVTLKLNGSSGPRMANDNLPSHALNWANVVASIKNNTAAQVWPFKYVLTISSPGNVVVRHVAWAYDGQGGDITNPVNLSVDGIPKIDTGKRMAFRISLYEPFLQAMGALDICNAPGASKWVVSMTVSLFNLGSNGGIIDLTDEVTFE